MVVVVVDRQHWAIDRSMPLNDDDGANFNFFGFSRATLEIALTFGVCGAPSAGNKRLLRNACRALRSKPKFNWIVQLFSFNQFNNKNHDDNTHNNNNIFPIWMRIVFELLCKHVGRYSRHGWSLRHYHQ